MNITLTINNVDFSSRVLTYKVQKEISYGKTYTTTSGKEVVRKKRLRPIIYFTLLPYTDTTADSDYDVFSASTLNVTFTDPDSGTTLTKQMRLMSNLQHTFLLSSIDGHRYYKGATIQLRSTTVM